MSAAPAYQQSRFVRRTRLQRNEYNKNFRMLDEETLAALTSPEADAITPLMSKIYLRLLQAPDRCCRGERELHFEGEVREGKRTKAWDQLCQHLRVSSETAQKALHWMHEQGIIGYSAFKNRVGIFIFLNRAAGSIGDRQTSAREKILQFPPASENKHPASPSDAAFNDPFGDSDSLDKDLNPHAPKNGADNTKADKKLSNPETPPTSPPQLRTAQSGGESLAEAESISCNAISVDEIVMRLQRLLEPVLKTVAVQTARHEHERTREWLDKHGIPKATRVAQREAYNVLRSHGFIAIDADSRRRADLQVGRASESYAPQEAHSLSEQEINETAETCVALLEAQGKSIEVTLSEISSEVGAWLLPKDAPRVREAAQTLLLKRSERR
jgi:hypothetical protein